MTTIIKAENLGKKYIIRHKQDPYDKFADVLVKPFKYAGQKLTQPFTKKPVSFTSAKEEFWALKDVSFEIKQGDRIGIIGRNGAGKSTLLKLISRITEPTTGKISIKGRISSLLEVGTGFHPELTGRENIYLNGAVLGMTRQEIKRKFDEIVAFAEVEKFLDTPVKRYSSGMYVRLAFAVAAHLEPEILIVDEVLAVGDVGFQEKCLKKMETIGKQGNTILFVSHNMSAIRSFCDRGIYLDFGKISFSGSVSDSIFRYRKQISPQLHQKRLTDKINIEGSGELRFIDVWTENETGEKIDTFFSGKMMKIILSQKENSTVLNSKIRFDIGINNLMLGKRVTWLSSIMTSDFFYNGIKDHGYSLVSTVIKKLPLIQGEYNLDICIRINQSVTDYIRNVCEFKVIEDDYYNTGNLVPLGSAGVFLMDYKFCKIE